MTGRARDRRPSPGVWPAALFGALVLLIWEAVTRVFDVDPRLVPSPTDVARALAERPGPLLQSAWLTLTEMLLGFSAGAIVGMAVGGLISYSRVVRSAVYPWLIVSQTIPIPAIAPVLVIWFGFSILPKVIVVALIVFFPVAVATADGLRAFDQEMVDLMRSFGASRARILREVQIPPALPYIFTGLKVAATLSVIGAVFGEWVGARGGLGYLLLLENRAVNTDGVFAVMFLLALLGVAFFGVVALAQRLAIPWHESSGPKGTTDTSPEAELPEIE